MERRDYTTTNRPIRSDIEKLIDGDPNSVKSLIFKARNTEMETLTDEPDVVGSLEYRERSVVHEYPPIVSKMLFCNFGELEFLKGYLDGGDSSLEQIEQDTEIRVLIAHTDVPIQSIVQWEEATADNGIRVVDFMVSGNEVEGMAPAAITRYVLKPYIDDGKGI